MIAETQAAARGRPAAAIGRGARVFASVALTCLASAVSAAPAHVSGLRVVEVGVFEATTVQKIPADTPSGVVLPQKDVRLAQSTTEVCPRSGVDFGLRYAVEGAPQGAPVSIVVRVNFPGAGVRYPGSRKRERYAE